MRFIKNWWLLLALLLPLVTAQETFTTTITPPELATKINSIAKYELTILNHLDTGQIYELYSPDVIWDIRTERPLLVPPNKKLTTKLLVRPIDVNPGIYGIPLTIRKVGSNEGITNTLHLELRTDIPFTSTYLPAFKGNASILPFIDPREPATITLDVKNLNRRNLTHVEIHLQSAVFNKKYTTNLEPQENKQLTFTITIDKQTPPQKDILTTLILTSENNKTYQYNVPPLPYEILSYEQIITTETSDTTTFTHTTTLHLTNHGNQPKEQTFTQPAPFFKRAFTTTTPPARVIKGHYTWTLPLDVREERTLIVLTNYSPLIVLLLALAGLAFLYYFLRPALAVTKKAVITTSKDGGIFQLKLRLDLKNRSRKPIKNVSLIDLTPPFFTIDKNFETHVMAPTKIVANEQKGTLLKWTINVIDGKEERVFAYKIIAKHPILGPLTLPAAVAKFTTLEGKERTTFSNKCKTSAHW